MKKLFLLCIVMVCAAVSYAQKSSKTGDVLFAVEGEGVPRVTESTKIVYVDKDPNTYGGSILAMSVTNFHDGIAAYEDPATRKWGTIDTLGNIIQTPYFAPGFGEPLPIYVNGCAFVKAPQGEKGFHVIDKKGVVIKKLPNIAKIDDNRSTDGYVGVLYYGDFYSGSKYGYLDSKGNEKFPALSETMKYAEAPTFKGFSDGLAPFECQSKHLWGFFNEQGKIVIPAQFYKVKSFSDGVAAVQKSKDGKWGFVDVSGKIILDFKYSLEPSNFNNGMAIVTRTTDRAKCVINKSGEILKENKFEIDEFNKNGIALIKTGYNQIHMMNSNFENIHFLGEMPVMTDALDGEQHFFDYDTFFVLEPSGWTATYVTDRDLKVIFKAYSIGEFSNGLAFVLFDDADGRRNSAFVNPQGDIVILFKYNEF